MIKIIIMLLSFNCYAINGYSQREYNKRLRFMMSPLFNKDRLDLFENCKTYKLYTFCTSNVVDNEICYTKYYNEYYKETKCKIIKEDE